MGVNTNDAYWMQHALNLADLSSNAKEVPIGSVLVLDNILLGKGWNKTIALSDPSSHAEVISIRQAAYNINNYRHKDSVIYITNEPCLMCMGAIIQARISKVVFASKNLKNGIEFNAFCLQRYKHMLYNINLNNYISTKEKCSLLLVDFFKKKRKEKKY